MRTFSVAVVAVVLLSNSVAFCEDSNREEVRRGLEDGWSVIWGKNFTEADWAQGTLAIGESIASENPGPFLQWFDQTLQENLDKIKSNMAGVAEADLKNWIVQSLKEHRIIQYQGLQIQAGFATYNRWQRIVYDEPRTGQRRVNGPFGTWTYVPYAYTERVEKQIGLPNWNQFYLRYKLISNGGGGGGSNPGANPSRLNVGKIVVHNDYGSNVVVRLYHPANPNNIYANWNVRPNDTSFLDANNQQIVIGSDWGIDIVFGNGVTGKKHHVGDVSTYESNIFHAITTNVFANGR